MMFLAFFLMFLITSAELKGGQYEVHRGCDTIYGHVLHTFGSVRSITECSLRCSEYDSCLSFQYIEVDKTCRLNAERYTTLSTGCTTMLAYAKITKRLVRKLINQKCSTSPECSVDNSQCFLENCQCEPGYSYQYTTERCLTSCDVYGSTFTLYPRFYISQHNTKVVSGYNTGEDCERACAEETAFVCRTVDYVPSRSKCYLSTATALTGPDLLKPDGSDPHYHYHRNCQ